MALLCSRVETVVGWDSSPRLRTVEVGRGGRTWVGRRACILHPRPVAEGMAVTVAGAVEVAPLPAEVGSHLAGDIGKTVEVVEVEKARWRQAQVCVRLVRLVSRIRCGRRVVGPVRSRDTSLSL